MTTMYNLDLLICFNPRTREGCDDGVTGIVNGIGVSIHAPVKGATSVVSVNF